MPPVTGVPTWRSEFVYLDGNHVVFKGIGYDSIGPKPVLSKPSTTITRLVTQGCDAHYGSTTLRGRAFWSMLDESIRGWTLDNTATNSRGFRPCLSQTKALERPQKP